MTSIEYTKRLKKTKKVELSNRSAFATLKTRHFYILLTLFAVCTLFYYFGELVDLAGWKALRWDFFYDVHDIHRLLFLAPIMYTCYFFGTKAILTVIVASMIVFLPRAIFISPFPDPIPRALLFVVIFGVICLVTRVTRNKLQHRSSAETITTNEINGRVGTDNGIVEAVFTIGTLEVDLSRRLIKRRGQIIKLTPKEYGLLSYLVRNNGRVVRHEELLRNVWGSEYGQENEYLRTFIRQLRLKIEDDPSNPQLIVTEPGVGYRLVNTD
jgi:DNA-binding winged helix-turn-helix (wHTH) protein